MWKVIINYEGQAGDYPSPVSDEASDMQILNWCWEALTAGTVVGINNVTRNLDGYKVQRDFANKTALVRPEVVYG